MAIAVPKSFASPRPEANLTDGPKAVVSGTVENLGVLPRGKPIVRTFRIENTGTTPLEITAQANCGCTVTEFDRTIPPGGRGKFTVELETGGLAGEFRKTVDVSTNDSTLPRFVLELHGEAAPAISISPNPAAPVALKWDNASSHEFRVETAAGVSVLEVVVSSDFATTRLEPLESGVYRLIMRFESSTPAGRLSVPMTIRTDAEFERQIPVTIHAEKGLVSTPRILQFAPASSDSDRAKAAAIVRSASGPVKILRAFSTDDRLKVETRVIQDGRIHQVTVSALRTAAAGKPGMLRKVILETDDPHQPRFEIPIR